MKNMLSIEDVLSAIPTTGSYLSSTIGLMCLAKYGVYPENLAGAISKLRKQGRLKMVGVGLYSRLECILELLFPKEGENVKG